jgi:ubiquinone/menaquinone biosynthesis C-methylase UbiE
MTFTGERYIPGEGGAQLAYEHMHRYLYAVRWARGKQVLDLACGNGYGTALLARRARHVWAIDLDAPALQDAASGRQANNVTFIQGDAEKLPFRNDTMGLIVAMEALEHIRDQERMVREMARVCSPEGLVLISTPNKAVYSDGRKYVNPFHIRELYFDEFADLLKRHFPYVSIAEQQIRAGSLISFSTAESLCEVIAEPVDGHGLNQGGPMYFLAVCSMKELREPIPAYSAYLDPADGFIHEVKQEIAELNKEIVELGRWGKSLEDVINEKDRSILDLQHTMAKEMESRDQTILDLQHTMEAELELRDHTILDLQHTMEAEIEIRDQRIRDLQNELKVQTTNLLDSLHRLEKEFDDRGKWALSLQDEVENLSRIRRVFLYKVLSRLRLLPK